MQVPAVGYIPVPRTNFSSAMVDGVMYIFGGLGPDGQDLGDLCAFRIKSKLYSYSISYSWIYRQKQFYNLPFP